MLNIPFENQTEIQLELRILFLITKSYIREYITFSKILPKIGSMDIGL